MGLISWIRNTYYTSRLNNADSAFQSEHYSEAEQKYQKILDKQPDAAEHLAKMYYEIAISGNDESGYLGKLKSLLSNTNYGKEKVSSYLHRLINHIDDSAEKYFQQKKYYDAYKYLQSIKDDKKGTDFTRKLRLYALYVNLKDFEDYSTHPVALIKTYCCKDIEPDVEDAIIGTVDRLYENRKLFKAYMLSDCLAETGNRKAIKKCVTIAFDVYKTGDETDKRVINEDILLDYISKDSQANLLNGLEKFAGFSAKYKNSYVQAGISSINAEPTINGAFVIFKKVWEATHDITLISTCASQSFPIAGLVYDYFIDNVEFLKSNVDCQASLFEQLNLFEDYNYILNVLKRFKKQGLDKKELYIAKVKSVMEHMDDDINRLFLLNDVLDIYSDDSWAVNEKMAMGERYQAEKDYTKAVQVYNELTGLHAMAQPRLAQLYYELSLTETDFSQKRDLIQKAYSFKNSHNPLFDIKEYQKLIPSLSASAKALVKDCFSRDALDKAYTTAMTFRAVDENCFEIYIIKLKSLDDKNYVLGTLASLQNDGIDVKSDYKEVVNNVVSSKDYDNIYKLNVLSQSITLYTDKDLSEQFVSKAIEVITDEKEKEKALAVFSKCWKQQADKKFLTAFVNQTYEFHSSFIDYLIDKTSILRWKKTLISNLCQCIVAFEDYTYSISVLDRLKDKGIDVSKPYVTRVLNELPSLSIDEQLTIINETFTKFRDDRLIDAKLSLSNVFEKNGRTDTALQILSELTGLHEMAEPELARLYYEENTKAKDPNSRLAFIIKGLEYNIHHSSTFNAEAYQTVYNKLITDYELLIDYYYSSGAYEKAYQLCLELKQYGSTHEWYEKYIALRSDAVSKIDEAENKISFIKNTFSILNEEGYDVKTVSSDAINALWDILHDAEVCLAATKPYEDRIKLFKEYSAYVETQCYKEKGRDLIRLLNDEIVKAYKAQGYKFEQDGLYNDAISVYSKLSAIADKITKFWCRIRCSLCNVKSDKEVKTSEITAIADAPGFAPEKKDLIYRYTLYLIKHKNNKEALSIAQKYLPEESDLIEVCRNECVKDAESLLDKLNLAIQKLINREATLAEAKELAGTLDYYDKELSPYLTGVHTRIETLRTSIQSYFLLKYFEEGLFAEALKQLKDSGKKWYKNDVYFRNLAVACLGMAETGQINNLNYKYIIVFWLTAVYRDQLFVNSLDYTSWDDAYTFTLKNSLGGSKEDSYIFLPENVNFDEPVESSVISIAEVQQSLLNRFEAALNEGNPNYRLFYDKQKDVMDYLVHLNLDVPCPIVAPYLADVTPVCLDKIKEALDEEYNVYGGENILRAGVMYNLTANVYANYKKSSDEVEGCLSAAKSMSKTEVNKLFSSTTVNEIREYPELYATFTTELQNILSKLIKDETPYKDIMNVFSIICRIMNENILSYILGNYINQCVVEKLNNKDLALATGLKELVEAFNVVGLSCAQLKSNIGNVLEALIGKYLTEGNSNDLTTIKSVLHETGIEFEKNVVNALSDEAVLAAVLTGHSDCIEAIALIPAATTGLLNRKQAIRRKAKEISANLELSKIVDKVNNKSISYVSALQQVYDLYKDNKDNSRVCDNLCTLVGICIREYFIADSFEEYKVLKVFNELKYNKSMTYRASAKALIEERESILDSLPLNARFLMIGSTDSSLNEKGKKLKSALQLYLDLA